MKCSYFSCGRTAVVREAWFDDPDEVPTFASGEVAWCPGHMERFGGNYE